MLRPLVEQLAFLSGHGAEASLVPKSALPNATPARVIPVTQGSVLSAAPRLTSRP